MNRDLTRIEFADIIIKQALLKKINNSDVNYKIQGNVLGLFTNAYYNILIDTTKSINCFENNPPEPYLRDDKCKSAIELLEEPEIIGFACLDGEIAAYLMETGKFIEDKSNRPIEYIRKPREYIVF